MIHALYGIINSRVAEHADYQDVIDAFQYRELAAASLSCDVASFMTESGDVVILHSLSVHGKAPVDTQVWDRRVAARSQAIPCTCRPIEKILRPLLIREY